MKRSMRLLLTVMTACVIAVMAAGCGKDTSAAEKSPAVSGMDTGAAAISDAPKFDKSHASVGGASLLMTQDELRSVLGEPDETVPHFPDIWIYRTGDTVDMEWEKDDVADRVEVRLYTDRFRLDNGACVGMTQKELCALFYDNGKGEPFVDQLSGEKIGLSLYGTYQWQDFQNLQKGDIHQYAFIDVTQHAEPVSYTAIADYHYREVTERTDDGLIGNVYNAKFYFDENAKVKYISLSVNIGPYL